MKHLVNIVISSKSPYKSEGGVWASIIYYPPNDKITLTSKELYISRYDLELDALLMSLEDIEKPSVVTVYTQSRTLSYKWKSANIQTHHILRLKVRRRKKRRR